jgi:hypothetical protein
MMKRLYALRSLFLFLLLLSFVASARAQSSSAAVRISGPAPYETSSEVTFNATVATVSGTPAHGTITAPSFTLQTSMGTVIPRLGRAALHGKYAIPLSAGKQVRVTGVKRNLGGKQIVLVRTLEMDGHTYKVRDARGFVLSHPLVDDSSASTLSNKAGGL